MAERVELGCAGVGEGEQRRGGGAEVVEVDRSLEGQSADEARGGKRDRGYLQS